MGRKANNTKQDIYKKDQARTKVKKNLFLKLYYSKLCNISAACNATGIIRNTFYQWKEHDPCFAAKITEEEERLIDFVESKLLQNINAGDNASIFFFLKCKAKSRGYIERADIVNVNYTTDDLEKAKQAAKELLFD
jgi:hypothetical protein